MTFSPTFAFYRDDRPLWSLPPDTFWQDIREEVAAELAYRQQAYPGMVRKGRLSRADADRELRVWRALAEDWGGLPRRDDTPDATWAEMVHALRREITLRRKFYPARVEAHRLDAAEADRKILLLEQCHDLMWHGVGAEATAARTATPRVFPEQLAAAA